MSKQKGDESAFGVAAGSVIPWREREHWGVGYTLPGEDFFLCALCENEAKAHEEARLRNEGPRRFSWEKDMVWSVKHYPAADPVRCENCGKPIGKARLEAFPRATMCVSCKQRQERR